MVRVKTQDAVRTYWDETVEATLSNTPMESAAIECVCGEVLGNHEMCSTHGCSGMVSSFRGTPFTRKFATDIDRNAHDFTWFHSTLDPYWEETLKHPDLPPVHIGVKETSEELGILNKHCGYFLYEIRLKDNATVAPYFCPDIECGWSETMDVFYDKVGADFVSYINIYEGMGNVSLIGDGSMLEVKSRTWVPVLEAPESVIYVKNILDAKRRFNRPDAEIAYEITQLEDLLAFLASDSTPELVS